ncbi:MAG: electron transporter RnfE [Pseudomonas sp.]|nr:MAG: electron transporter RnfE [Pseudomonas sp.]
MKPALPLLSLVPLVGCTDLLIEALGIGLAGLLLIPLCALLLMPLRNRLDSNALLLAALLIGASLAGCIELTLQLLSSELAAALALFVPLLVLPCLTLALDKQANPLSGIRAGLGFGLTALALGTLRETLGHGSLLAHADWLLGPAARGWQWSPVLPVLTTAAGGFILLGLLLALFRHFARDDLR